MEPKVASEPKPATEKFIPVVSGMQFTLPHASVRTRFWNKYHNCVNQGQGMVMSVIEPKLPLKTVSYTRKHTCTDPTHSSDAQWHEVVHRQAPNAPQKEHTTRARCADLQTGLRTPSCMHLNALFS